MMKKIKTRLFKWFKVLLFLAVALVTLGALVLVFESWRAERDWKKMRDEIVERGEPIDWRDLADEDIPDEDNLAMTPLLRPLSEYTVDYSKPHDPLVWNDPAAKERVTFDLPRTPRGDDGEASDGRVDFDAWRKAFEDDERFDLPETRETAPEDVLFALRKYDAELAEITEARRRPRFQYSHDEKSYDTRANLTYIQPFKSWARVLKLRAAAYLETMETDQAFEDIRTMLRLGDLLKDEPIVINQLVQIALRAIAIKSIWYGLVDHRWSPEQLERFQDYLATHETRQVVPIMFVGERAYSGMVIRKFVSDEHGKTLNIASRIIHTRNQIAGARLFNLLIDEAKASLETGAPLFQLGKDYAKLAGIPREHPNAALHERFPESKPDNGLFSNFSHPYTAMVVGLVPTYTRVLAKFDRLQVLEDLTKTACSLERYWLEHGEYPGDLASLVPTYLSEIPKDLMNGQPLRYRKRDDGWFDLYSVGEDQEDDRGVYVPAAIGEREHDLPWPLPIPQTSPRLF